MENNYSSRSRSDVFVGVQPVGGSSGDKWVFKPKSAIKKIIISHGHVIDSLIFICENGDHSPKFGGNGGDKTDEVNISHRDEYLTGIWGTFGDFYGEEVIKSLSFNTNTSTYGPFGKQEGNSFSLFVEDYSDCSLVGFHGRSGSYLVSIGYYARPPLREESVHCNPITLTKDNICSSCSGGKVVVGIGPVGGSSGEKWEYKPESAIKQIIVRHALVIDSLIFVCENGNHSSKLGGDGGWTTDKVDIKNPDEYLTGISGTTVLFSGWEVVQTLQFHTNKCIYGPFGKGTGSAFSLSFEGLSDCSIAGFHGRSGLYLVAIGIYARPSSSSVLPKPITFDMPSSDAMTALAPRNPGPFGGPFGKEWDDGVFTGISQILVHVDDNVNAIQGVRFEYTMAGKDGNVSVRSPRHGEAGSAIYKICIDYRTEFLLGMSGFSSPVESNGGMETIRSIKFTTNKGVYGPFGSQLGTYFCSPVVPTGKIVGFFGKAASYLHAIGVHIEYEEGVEAKLVELSLA